MKDFVCFFFLSFLICYAVVAFGLSNIWVLIALAAAVLGALLTALFNLNNKVEALKQQVEELAGKARFPLHRRRRKQNKALKKTPDVLSGYPASFSNWENTNKMRCTRGVMAFADGRG